MACDKTRVVTALQAEECCEQQLNHAAGLVVEGSSQAFLALREAQTRLAEDPENHNRQILFQLAAINYEMNFSDENRGDAPIASLVDGKVTVNGLRSPSSVTSGVSYRTGVGIGSAVAAVAVLLARDLINRKKKTKTKQGDCCFCLEQQLLRQDNHFEYVEGRHRHRVKR